MSDTPHRILIISVGSRGDAQPYIALANRLIGAGHEVALALNGPFEDFVRDNCIGATFYPLAGDPAELIQSKEFEDAFYSGNFTEITKIMTDTMKRDAPVNMKRLHDYVREYKPTCILGGVVNTGEALALGQKYLIPVIFATTIPAYPSEDAPLIGVTVKPVGNKWLNRNLNRLAWKLQWLAMGEPVQELRKQLGLPTIDNGGFDSAPILNMFSNLVFPRPADYPPHVIDTSYWVLPPTDDYVPPQELSDFLDAGSPPVYIGFGSMPVRDKQSILKMFSTCLTRTGNRAIYCGGWSKIDDIEAPENIFMIKGAPHEWLLPKCAMAFHHGGAGTTAASLRAGIPTIILSVLIDQPFWSHRVVQLGVGQDHPCALKDLTESYLLHQMEHCQKERIRQKAKELGEKLRQEDGTFIAASYIVSYASKNRNPGVEQLNYLPDSSTSNCMDCKTPFTLLNRRHHCMTCGSIFCSNCVKYFDIPNYETFRYCCRACAKLRRFDFDAQK